MSSPFRYRAWNLLTLEPLDSLPYQGVQFGRAINQPGAFKGVLPLTAPGVQDLDWRTASMTGKTLLGVELAGTLVWGGILWTRDYDGATKAITVGASTPTSYFQQRLQAADYTSTWQAGVDPMVATETIITDALAAADIAGGITVVLNPPGGEGGPQITPSYPATSLQSIDSIMSTLSQMGYGLGYDYSVDVAYLPGTDTPALTMNLWYPRQGRTAQQSQLVINRGQLVTWTYPEDSTQQALAVTETGSGTGGIQPVTATAVDEITDYPLLEVAISRTQVNDDATLSNIALGDLALKCWPVVTPTLTLPAPVPGPDGTVDPSRLGFGTFDIGDDFLLRIDPVAGGGMNSDPRFPEGMEFEWRINQWTCNVADAGLSTLVIDAGLPPISTIPPARPPL